MLRNYAGADARVEQVFTNSIALLRQQGAVIIDDLSIDRKGMGNAEFEVLLYEFKSNLNAYLESISPQDSTTPRDLAAVITYNQQHSGLAMPFFGQDILVLAEAKGLLGSLIVSTVIGLAISLAPPWRRYRAILPSPCRTVPYRLVWLRVYP